MRLPCRQVIAWYVLGGCGSKALPVLVQTARNLGGYPIYEVNPKDEQSVSDPVLLALGMGDKSAVPVLIEVINNNKEPLNTVAAVVALGQIGSEAKEAIPILLKMKIDVININGDSAIAWALRRIIDKDDIPTLLTGLKDTNSEVSTRARIAICSLKDFGHHTKEVVPILIAQVQDSNNYESICAIEALGHIGQEAKAAVPYLISILQKKMDESSREAPHVLTVHILAAEALGNLGVTAQESIPTLTAMLKEKNMDLFLSAALALRKIQGDTKNVNSILKTIISKEIKELAQENFEMPTVGIRGFKRAYNRSADILTKIGKDAVPDLIKTLNNSDSSTARYYAAIVLGNIGSDAKDAIPSLLEALKDSKDLKVRHRATIALGQIGATPMEAAMPLKRILEDEKNPLEVRRMAAIALMKMGIDVQEFFTKSNLMNPSNAVCPLAKATKGVAIPKFDIYTGMCVLSDAIYGGPASGGPGIFTVIVDWLTRGK